MNEKDKLEIHNFCLESIDAVNTLLNWVKTYEVDKTTYNLCCHKLMYQLLTIQTILEKTNTSESSEEIVTNIVNKNKRVFPNDYL